MPESLVILRVAIPTPLRRVFDYLAPRNTPLPRPGARLRVPFGRRDVVGILLELAQGSAVPPHKLRTVRETLDHEPLLPPATLKLLHWAAGYYYHPIGEVIQSALPVALRHGRAAGADTVRLWRLSRAGCATESVQLQRAPLQQKLLRALAQHDAGMSAVQLTEVSSGWRAALRQLEGKGLVESFERQLPAPASGEIQPALTLSVQQQYAVEAIQQAMGAFQPLLLLGITGSGKTEVYLHAIEAALARSQQALVLVPEIGLTPQLVARFRARFMVPVVLLHSGLSEQERLQAWLQASSGEARIVLGTRSAVFTPMPYLGLIVVDEEHDQSYKQQDGFRYHARDVAVMRASQEQVPIVLGSATPSLESMHKVAQGKYRLLSLSERTGSAELPPIQLLDMRRLALHEGLSPPVLLSLQQCLDRREQSLVFLNRRGYAPVYLCHDCGWLAPCERCDAKLILHKASGRLRCHHCGADKPVPHNCPQCDSSELHPLGEGTERLEASLQRLLPTARILRIDRDSTRRKGALEKLLQRIHDGDADILVGTQMLAKGHDFPNVTLVAVLNADQGLYSVDFRATEQLFQQVAQVSGRAGRADKPGRVLVQTYYPEHPVYHALCQHDYQAFVEHALHERRQTHYPPYAHLALLRAEAAQQANAMQFMQQAHQLAQHCAIGGVQIMEPVPAPMERRAGRYRMQLLLQAQDRAPLHRFLSHWLESLDESKQAKRVRWSLDVDPMDLY